MSAARIYLYKRFERFWHWSQALLIIIMMVTCFEVHVGSTGIKIISCYSVPDSFCLFSEWDSVLIIVFCRGVVMFDVALIIITFEVFRSSPHANKLIG